MHWESYSQKEIKEVVFKALEQKLDYRDKPVLALPASYLDNVLLTLNIDACSIDNVGLISLLNGLKGYISSDKLVFNRIVGLKDGWAKSRLTR